VLVWTLSVGAIIFGSIIGYQRLERSRDLTYYAVGYTVGTAVTVAVLVIVLNMLVRRARRIAGGPSPLALMAISVLAVSVQHAYRNQQHGQITSQVERCRASDPAPFGPAPPGVTLVDDASVTTFLSRVPLPDGLPPSDYVIRRVADTRGASGVAVAYPGLGEMPGELDRFVATTNLIASGRPARPSAATGIMSWAESDDASVAVGRDGCWAVVVEAPKSIGTAWAQALMSG
jgi:hypothetical protein